VVVALVVAVTTAETTIQALAVATITVMMTTGKIMLPDEKDNGILYVG